MQPTEAIIDRVLREIGRLDDTQIAPAARLREDLGFDSLALIDVAVTLEDALRLAVPDEELERVQTVGELAEYLKRAGAV